MPGEEPRKPYGILSSGEPAPALNNRNRSAGADGTRVTDSVPSRDDLQRPLSDASISTTVTAIATPQQQFVGHDITISGQLTADGAPVAGEPVKLYFGGAGLWSDASETTTDTKGGYAFKFTQPTAGTRTFKVAFPGSATHEPSVSDELSVTFVTIPTTITATATLLQQFVGHDITISGQLTTDGAPVAEAPITLFNAADVIERVPTANTTTDASGYYQFTVADAAPSHHTYVVRAPGTSTYAPVQSSEISVTFVTIPTTITTTASLRQQFVGHDITISGQLTAKDSGLAGVAITLYNADDIIERVPTANTTTDASGYYQFTVADAAPSHHTYVVCALGSATHEPSVSDELSVTFVTIPTTITATATLLQQFVGHDITISGQLTTDGAPVAEAPITLFNAADVIERVPTANTTTDASGYYQFTVADAAPSHHTYVVRAPGTSTYAPVQSSEISVTFVTIPTTITATATPRQQYVGRDVTITGRLLADGIPVADAPIILYNADDIIQRAPIANTTTDASGFYQFTVAEATPNHHTYVVCALGSATHEPSVSDELSVTFVTIPTTITATATPRQQYVGHHTTITGKLTANGAGLVEVPVVLYNMDDPMKKVVVATATTDAYGYYQFTLMKSVAITHAYAVCTEGNNTYSRAQSTEILVTYATRAAEAPAVKIRTFFNLVWYELLAILLILAGEGLLFAGHRIAGVGVQALNIVMVAIIVVAMHGERVQLVQALALVSIFRVVNLSFALVPTVTVYWLAIVYGVLLVPIIAIIVHEKMSRYDLGIDNIRRSVLLFPLGVLIGTGFALVEYRILANPPLIPNTSALELIQLSIVMIFFVALVEALLFFVLLQRQLIDRSSAVAGILITSVIFGAMHAGYANVYELLFSTGAGVVLGIAFYKTRNLPLIVTILAVNNILLFGLVEVLTRIATIGIPH